MCWVAIDEQSFARTGRYQLHSAACDGRIEVILAALKCALRDADLILLSACADELALLDLAADSVDEARYWQDPDDLDRVLADQRVVEVLEPVAEAIAGAPASAWWSSGLVLDNQVVVEWREDDAPPPRLEGAAVVLAEWKKRVVEDEARFHGKQVSGPWWSPPIWSLSADEVERWGGDLPGLGVTTRSLRGLGAIGLLLEEDSSGTLGARCWPVRSSRQPKVLEIRDAADWLDLVNRFPLDVTWGRQATWSLATGLNLRWLLPDWSVVAQEYEAVHLTLMGYLGTSGRALELDTKMATLIAGWNPDATYWLADLLELAGEPTEWLATEHDPPRSWHTACKDGR